MGVFKCSNSKIMNVLYTNKNEMKTIDIPFFSQLFFPHYKKRRRRGKLKKEKEEGYERRILWWCGIRYDAISRIRIHFEKIYKKDQKVM